MTPVLRQPSNGLNEQACFRTNFWEIGSRFTLADRTCSRQTDEHKSSKSMEPVSLAKPDRPVNRDQPGWHFQCPFCWNLSNHFIFWLQIFRLFSNFWLLFRGLWLFHYSSSPALNGIDRLLEQCNIKGWHHMWINHYRKLSRQCSANLVHGCNVSEETCYYFNPELINDCQRLLLWGHSGEETEQPFAEQLV